MHSQSQKYRDKCKKLLVCMPEYVKDYYLSKTINSYSQISLNNYLIEFRRLLSKHFYPNKESDFFDKRSQMGNITVQSNVCLRLFKVSITS